jgi:hypothetical protein
MTGAIFDLIFFPNLPPVSCLVRWRQLGPDIAPVTSDAINSFDSISYR